MALAPGSFCSGCFPLEAFVFGIVQRVVVSDRNRHGYRAEGTVRFFLDVVEEVRVFI